MRHLLRDPANVRSFLVLIALSLLGLGTHLLPHDMGITTAGAIGMLSAAFLPVHLMSLPGIAFNALEWRKNSTHQG